MAVSAQVGVEQRVRDVFAQLFEQRDFSRAREWWSDDSVDHFLAAGFSARGVAELEAFFRELFGAVPDLRMEIEHVVADDTTRHAVVQWRMTGTATGTPFQGIEMSGRAIALRGCDVFRLDTEGRVDENTIYYDGADFARQIGLLPPRDSRADRGMLAAFNAVTHARRLRRR